MTLGRLNHIGVAPGRPLPFRGEVGVGAIGIVKCRQRPIPLRLGGMAAKSRCPSPEGEGLAGKEPSIFAHRLHPTNLHIIRS